MTISAQVTDLAVPPVRVADEGEGLPPGNRAAVAEYTAHRVDDAWHHLQHAGERLAAARKAADTGVRQHHLTHLLHNLQRCLDAGHELADNMDAHYPAEAAELKALTGTIGLAAAVSPAAKTATFAHLTQTLLNHTSHTMRHAQAMAARPSGAEFDFNADHADTHLAGAAEHARKLAGHIRDNYPAEARFLEGLQAAELAGIAAQAAGLIGAQVIDLRGWEGWRDEPRGKGGQWVRGGAAVTSAEKAAGHAPHEAGAGPPHELVTAHALIESQQLQIRAMQQHQADTERQIRHLMTAVRKANQHLSGTAHTEETRQLRLRLALHVGIICGGALLAGLTAGLGAPVYAAVLAGITPAVVQELTDYQKRLM